MSDDMNEENLWELAFERRKRSGLLSNRIMVSVAANSIGEAFRAADAKYGADWECWSIRHVGRRIVMRASPEPSAEPKE